MPPPILPEVIVPGVTTGEHTHSQWLNKWFNRHNESLTFVADEYDCPGNGSNINANLVALMDDANDAAIAKGPFARATIAFNGGIYGVNNNLSVPERLSWEGEGKGNVEIRNLSTNWLGGVIFRGSGISCRGLTYNGRRAHQIGAITGGTTIGFVKPAGVGGHSGKITLAASVTAGASSFTGANLTFGGVPLLPRDVISFYDATNYETVRVADSYVIGATTIPITGTFSHSWSTGTASVLVFSTDNWLVDCRINAIGIVGSDHWHAFGGGAINCEYRDHEDTGIAVSAMGSRNLTFAHNDCETTGKWNIAIDGATATEAGPTGLIDIFDNKTRFLKGDPAGAFESIGVSSGGPTEYINIHHNVCDISEAGNAGISTRFDLSTHINIHNNLILCGGRAGTNGILRYGPGAGNTTSSDYLRVTNNTIIGAITGIQLADILQATIEGNTIIGPSAVSAAISVITNNNGQQVIKTLGNIIRLANASSVAFTSVGSTPNSSPIFRSVGDTVIGTFFLVNALQVGWSFFSDHVPQARADTSGATLAALETEVNFIKARLREAGIGLKP